MEGTNVVQQLLCDFGAVISTTAQGASSPLDKAFLFLLSLDLVLWLFLPFVLLLALWRISAIATQLGRVAITLSNMTAVLGEAMKDQAAAVHHLRDRTQTGFEALGKNVDRLGESVQHSARDVNQGLDRVDGHVQTGANDIAKQMANLYDRLGKFMSLSGMKGVGELDEPTEDDLRPEP